MYPHICICMCTHHSSGGHIEATYPATGCQDKKISCYALYVSATPPAPRCTLTLRCPACPLRPDCPRSILVVLCQCLYFISCQQHCLITHKRQHTHTHTHSQMQPQRGGELHVSLPHGHTSFFSFCRSGCECADVSVASGNSRPCSHAIYIFCSCCRSSWAWIQDLHRFWPMSWLAPPMPSSSPLPLQLSSTAKQKACCLISSWFSFALLRSPWAELISQLFFFLWETISEHYRSK